MAKVVVKLKTFMVMTVSLVILTIVSSCVDPKNSFLTGGEMAEVRQIFPAAINVAEIPLFIGQDAHVSGRPDDATVSEIKGNSGILGYIVESKVVSRSGPFRIRVLLDKQFYVKQATVISYPWDRGRDVCKRTFTDQFKGKGPGDPIRLGKDIDAMTGATISSRVMAEGVRNSIEFVKNSL